MTAALRVLADNITPAMRDVAAALESSGQGSIVTGALRDVGARWRRIMAEEWRAGRPGGTTLAPLHPITEELRRGRITAVLARYVSRRRLSRRTRAAFGAVTYRVTRKRSTKAGAEQALIQAGLAGFGGRLPPLLRYTVNRHALTIGFLDSIAGRGVEYQSSRNRAWTSAERRMLHVRLARRRLPSTYNRPARYVIAPQLNPLLADADRVFYKSVLARINAARQRTNKP